MAQGIADYAARLAPYCRLEIAVVADEAAKILARLAPDAYKIALTLDGQSLSSAALADKLRHLAISARPRVDFIIGGSDGLPPQVANAADMRLCLSAMTFPHQLARLILLEQLYRAFRIISGEPYHK